MFYLSIFGIDCDNKAFVEDSIFPDIAIDMLCTNFDTPFTGSCVKISSEEMITQKRSFQSRTGVRRHIKIPIQMHSLCSRSVQKHAVRSPQSFFQPRLWNSMLDSEDTFSFPLTKQCHTEKGCAMNICGPLPVNYGSPWCIKPQLCYAFPRSHTDLRRYKSEHERTAFRQFNTI